MSGAGGMIDAVAKALCNRAGSPQSWDATDDQSRDAWRGDARAAVEAMREPTGRMVNEGSIYAEGETLVEACENAKKIWQTMIAAALRDSGSRPTGENPERSGGVEGEARQSGGSEASASPKFPSNINPKDHNHG